MKYFIALTLSLFLSFSASCQFTYLGQVFNYQDGIYGMRGALSIDASDDGNIFYVSSQYGLSVFRKDSLSHSLEFIKSYLSNDDGNLGLNDVVCVKVSHDKRNVYTISRGGKQISIYQRDILSGDIHLYRIISGQDIAGYLLDGLNDICLSDNDMNLYIAVETSNIILAFDRDSLTGDLSMIQSAGIPTTSWLNSVRLSKDNRFMYATYSMSDQLAVFERDSITGLLSFKQLLSNNENGVQGLWSPVMLEVSNDDKSLYVLGYNSIAQFTRNLITGELTFVNSYVDNENGIDGLAGSYSMSISPDDRNIYVVSFADTSVVVFDRDLLDGHLIFKRRMNIFNHQLAGGYSNSAMLCHQSQLFVTEYWTSKLYAFFRDTITGDLTLETDYYDGMGASIKGLYKPAATYESQDGRNVYIIGAFEGITIHTKDDSTGNLRFRCLIQSSDPANNWSKNVYSLSTSIDNEYVYAVTSGNQISVFQHDNIHDSLIFMQNIPILPEYGISIITSIIRSPDGKYFYLSYTFDNKIATFKYNQQSGSLEYIDTYDLSTYSVCCVSGLKITLDGGYLFASNQSSKKLIMCKRDSLTGEISLVNSISSFPNQVNFNVLDYNISNDGKNLYAINTYSKTINTFKIDTISDSAVPIDSQYFSDICNSGSPGANLISVSGDDRFIYVTSINNFNIKVFYRNSVTGKLTYLKTLTENSGNYEGFEGISSMLMGRNKFDFYFSSTYENSISSNKLNMELGPDIIACDGDTIALSPGPQYESYLWSTGETSSSINVNTSGTYSVRVTDQFGNAESDTLLATFYPLPPVEFPFDELYMCYSDTISLSAAPGSYSYYWNTGDTTNQINVFQSGNYILRMTSDKGCVNSDSVLVIVNPLPVFSLGNDTVIYKGHLKTISIPGFASYRWYDGSEEPEITIDSSSFVTNPLLVWLEVTDSNLCQNTDTLNLVYIDSGYGIKENGKAGLKIGPNPFSDFLYINCGQPVDFIEITDMSGRLVIKKQLGTINSAIETGLIPNGVYVIHLKVINNHYYYKISCNR